MTTSEAGTEIIKTTPQEWEQGQARLTPAAIAHIAEQMDLAQDLVTRLLRYGIDYGITPGTQGPGLWDAGAAKIIRAFRCYAQHKVLFHEESDDVLSWTIEAQLVNEAGMIVGSGLGAASTRETKYKYRWVLREDALREGYTEEDLNELKVRDDARGVRYRVENPEYGELVHTLLAMASKRAEVDAAKSLPGVASALHVKFDPRLDKHDAPPQPTTPGTREDISLPVFWATVKGSGLNEDDVHRTLQVKSIKDWLAGGKTLREAVTQILAIAVRHARSAKLTATTSGTPSTQPSRQLTPPDRLTKDDVPNVDMLVHLAKAYWGLVEAEVFPTLGYRDRQNFIEADVQTPFEAFQVLLEQHSG